MQYRHQSKSPVTKEKREARRNRERKQSSANEERNRQRSRGGGNPNELGVTQGQNGEQGNSIVPENTRRIGRTPQ